MTESFAAAVLGLALVVTCSAPAQADPRVALRIISDGIPEPLAGPGDIARGRALLVARDNANCVLCHAVPDPALHFAGNVGPSLAGIASRLTPAQIRLRIADSLRVNPGAVMPSYYRTEGLQRVAAGYRGQPILGAQDVEDLVAFLGTLR